MKIFYPILWFYPSQAGGPANALYWLIRELEKKNFSSKVTATSHGLPDDFEQSQYDFGQNNEVEFVSGTKDFLNVKQFRKIRKSQIVHFSSLFFPPTLPFMIYAVILGKKIIISPRGELYAPALAIKPLRKKIWIQIFRFFSSRIFFHATTTYEKQTIEKAFSRVKGIKVIPNYMILPPKVESTQSKHFLFLGRINPIKNIDILIRSFHLLKQMDQNQDFKLILAGEALLPYEKSYKNTLKILIRELDLDQDVLFAGHIEGMEKETLLASSRALILPSKSENFGNVVLEALAQGSPVIASKQTPWEDLDTFNAGYWVEPTESGLLDAMSGILELEDCSYAEMRKNAYDLCRNKYDITFNVGNWINFYQNL